MERLERRSVHPRHGREAFRHPRSRGGVVPLVPRDGKDHLRRPARCRRCWRRNICRSASTRTPIPISPAATAIGAGRRPSCSAPTAPRSPRSGAISSRSGCRRCSRPSSTIPRPALRSARPSRSSRRRRPSSARQQRAELTKNFDESYDDKLGGWGENQKFIDADSMDLAITRAEAGDATATKRARQTLDAAIALIDPVWGGVFQYSEAGSWTPAAFRKDHVVPGAISAAIQPGLCAVEGPEISRRRARHRALSGGVPVKPRRRVLCQPGCRSRSRHRRPQILRAWRRRAAQARHAAHRQESLRARERLGDLGACRLLRRQQRCQGAGDAPSARRNG